MLIERVPAPEPEHGTIGPGMLILAAVGCFTLGFAALMLAPGVWPQAAPRFGTVDVEPLHLREAGMVTRPSAPGAGVPGVVTEIRPSRSAPQPQRIVAYGTLAGLAECKAAMRAGDTFAKVGPEQMAALFGTRGKPLNGAEIDAGCRKLTEE